MLSYFFPSIIRVKSKNIPIAFDHTPNSNLQY
jgi:hypothetical protein